jgi:hypothetical protein
MRTTALYYQVRSSEEAVRIMTLVRMLAKEKGVKVLKIVPSGPYGLDEGVLGASTTCVKATLTGPIGFADYIKSHLTELQ